MEYISYNVGTQDFPDIYACALGPVALGIYIRQIPRAHVITITYITLIPQFKGNHRNVFQIYPGASIYYDIYCCHGYQDIQAI